MPSFHVAVNSKHQSTLSLSGPGVLSCIANWVDRTDQPVPAEEQVEAKLSLVAWDSAAHESLTWPPVDLKVGDVVTIQLRALEPSHPEPSITLNDAKRALESKRNTSAALPRNWGGP